MESGVAPGRDRCRRSLTRAGDRNAEPDDAEDRLAGDRALAEHDPRRDAGGEIDGDPAAEADQADPLARFDHVALLDEGEDAARDQAGNLGEADAQPVGAFDQDMLTLIVLA